MQEVAVSGHLDVDDGDILMQWAIDGEGIVIQPAFEVAVLRLERFEPSLPIIRLSQSRSLSCTPIADYCCRRFRRSRTR